MEVFVALYLIIVTLSFLEINVKTLRFGNKRIDVRKISFWTITIMIMLIGVLRNEYFAVDAYTYETYYFEPVKTKTWAEIIMGSMSDKGFYLLSKAISLISGDLWVYNALLFIIVFAIEAYVIYKESDYPSISYLVFVSMGLVSFNYSILRQAVAISICFYAFRYIKEKHIIKFIICVLLASAFHQTALLFLVAYPVANWNIRGYALWKKCILLVGSLVLMRFMPILFQFYSKTDYSGSAVEGEGYFLLIYFVVLIGVIAWLMSKGALKTEAKVLYNILFCVLYFQIGALAFSLFTRVVNYFLLALILIIPFIIKKSKSKNSVLFIFIGMLVFRYMLIINGLKYISVFEQISG